eukprot:m.232357 g.232357  ORF g.232357 m.232357 type:complete len:414 (-) comp19274_c0_seq7:142-1383(-)
MSKNYSQDKSRATDQYKLDSENGGTQTHVPPNTRSPVHATDCKTQSSSTSSPRRRIHSRPKIQPLSQIPCDPTLVSAQDEQEPPQTPSSLSNLTSDGNSSHIQFDILRRLHEGEHRRVDLIEKDGQEMVLKVLVFARENSPDRLKLIRTELDLLKRIDCELIVAHFGSYLYLSAREVHIFMEYMDGGSLDRVQTRVGRVPEPILTTIAVRVVGGLKYLWDQHTALHRDIKPANILVNTRGQVKLCDFGTSRILEHPDHQAMTFIGTFLYMSPERLEAVKHGLPSDVWALGISLLELATGYPPVPLVPHDPPVVPMRTRDTPLNEFKRVSTKPARTPILMAVMTDISSGKIGIAPECNRYFSPEFRAIIARMLTLAPEERVSVHNLAEDPWLNAVAANTDEMASYVLWVLSLPT